MNKMPVLFVGHGSPMNALDAENPFNQGFRRIAQKFAKPKAILMISAHWYGNRLQVTSGERPPNRAGNRIPPPSRRHLPHTARPRYPAHQRHTLPAQSVAGLARYSRRQPAKLRHGGAAHRLTQRRASRWDGYRAESRCITHTLPPSHPRKRHHRRLPLATRAENRHFGARIRRH